MVNDQIYPHQPVLIAPEVARSKDILPLFDNFNVVNTTEQLSKGLNCAGFRKFGLYVGIDSTGAPTTLQIKIQFLNPRNGKWYTLKQGLFASLYYEDTDTANGIYEIFQGDCAGRELRVTLTGVGTTTAAYFTTSIHAEFYN